VKERKNKRSMCNIGKARTKMTKDKRERMEGEKQIS